MKVTAFRILAKPLGEVASYRLPTSPQNLSMNFISIVAERPLSWLAIALAFILTWAVPAVIKHALLWNIPMAGKANAGVEERRKAYLGGARKVYTDGYRAVSCFLQVPGRD